MQAFSKLASMAAVLPLVLMSGVVSRSQAQGDGAVAETELFVGTASGCNDGIVTTDRNFRNCATDPIGWSVRDNAPDSARTERLHVGVTADRNAGVVTTDSGYLNAATKPIGYAATSKYAGRRLYVGTAPNCNQGEVTTNEKHKGCATRDLGYTYQKR